MRPARYVALGVATLVALLALLPSLHAAERQRFKATRPPRLPRTEAAEVLDPLELRQTRCARRSSARAGRALSRRRVWQRRRLGPRTLQSPKGVFERGGRALHGSTGAGPQKDRPCFALRRALHPPYLHGAEGALHAARPGRVSAEQHLSRWRNLESHVRHRHRHRSGSKPMLRLRIALAESPCVPQLERHGVRAHRVAALLDRRLRALRFLLAGPRPEEKLAATRCTSNSSAIPR